MNSVEASKKAEEIRREVKDSKYPWASEDITVSVGVACYPEVHVEKPEELLQTSDRAMYEAKTEGGKNRVIVCT